MVTLAPNPAAILAAWVPTIPPPNTNTLAGATPGTPPRRIPLPPMGFSRYLAPSWMAILPATHHWNQQRKDLSGDSTVSVGQTNRPTFNHGLGQWLIRSKVKVSKQKLVFLNEFVFLGNRLLYLNDHFCLL